MGPRWERERTKKKGTVPRKEGGGGTYLREEVAHAVDLKQGKEQKQKNR